MTRVILICVAALLAGCGGEPVEISQDPSGAITIRVEMTDTLVSYSTMDSQTFKITAIRSAWRINDDTYWPTSKGLTVYLHLVPDTTSADTVCYTREDCK